MKTLLRLDLNVPIKNGQVKDTSRIENYTTYIQDLLKNNNKVTIITHLGRPKNKEPEYSTKNLIPELEKIWNVKIVFIDSYDPQVINMNLSKLGTHEILLLENTRFFEFEKANDTKEAKKIASAFDNFIFDAFSTSHRKHLSTNAIVKFLPSTLGKTCKEEINNLNQALNTNKPLIIMGGAKAQTKLELIETFLKSASYILVGGVLANTFLKAQGFNIQKSLYEENLIKFCQNILQNPNSKKIILPFDFLVTKDLDSVDYRETEILKSDEKIADIGPKTTKRFIELITQSESIIFNGPLGYIENINFVSHSKQILETVSKSKHSFLGGGDTLKLLNLTDKTKTDFSFVSMAGGAMLEYLAKNGNLEVIEEIKNSI